MIVAIRDEPLRESEQPASEGPVTRVLEVPGTSESSLIDPLNDVLESLELEEPRSLAANK